MMENGEQMYELAQKLFPICRSITGNGVRQTLNILKEVYEDIKIYEVPSGTNVFDWTVPKEWNIFDAYIENSKGEKIIDMNNNNLHVMGYSTKVDKWVSLKELKEVIYTQEDQPDLIPYVTSYYKERYGFAMSENQKNQLSEDKYHIYINSELKEGSLTYGEIIIPGETKEEIFISTYICHPSMANNELSGPCVAIYLANWIKKQPKRRYTYRIIFIPETIGSITYLSKNIDDLKRNVIAGFNLTCIGDNRTFSYVESRYGNTLADKVAKNILQYHYPEYKSYSFLQRGSDERQYCAPGVDLPLCVLCRSKFWEYPEYHTSADDLNFISPEGLEGGFEVCTQIIEALENNNYYQTKCLCEPKLDKRNLMSTLSQKGKYDQVQVILDILAYSDGKNDLLDISNRLKVSVKDLLPIIKTLIDEDLIKII